MKKIGFRIKLLETVEKEFGVEGTTGLLWKSEKGMFFRPDNTNDEFDKAYPDGINMLGYQWERTDE